MAYRRAGTCFEGCCVFGFDQDVVEEQVELMGRLGTVTVRPMFQHLLLDEDGDEWEGGGDAARWPVPRPAFRLGRILDSDGKEVH